MEQGVRPPPVVLAFITLNLCRVFLPLCLSLSPSICLSLSLVVGFAYELEGCKRVYQARLVHGLPSVLIQRTLLEGRQGQCDAAPSRQPVSREFL